MSQPITHPIMDAIAANTHINEEQYAKLYQQSVDDPTAFWQEHAQILDWITPFTA